MKHDDDDDEQTKDCSAALISTIEVVIPQYDCSFLHSIHDDYDRHSLIFFYSSFFVYEIDRNKFRSLPLVLRLPLSLSSPSVVFLARMFCQADSSLF